MSDLSKILKALDKIIDLEEVISNEIKKEKNAKWRKKLQKAVKARDTSTIRDMWFNPDK